MELDFDSLQSRLRFVRIKMLYFDQFKEGDMPIDFQGVCPLLQVFDMPAALRFYRDLLGFEVIGQAPPGAHDDLFGWVLLAFKGTEIMLNTAYDDNQRPPQPDPARIAAHSDTCLYF